MPYKNFIGLGIAGNFALHLAQAGELEEFKDIITADEAAPKGIFPFYLPNPTPAISAKEILSTYPLSSNTIALPKRDVNVQAEPEVALVCELMYEGNTLLSIKPTHFGAYNDCSIRVAGANKISDKKNWGKDSKGFSDTLIEIDKFESGGIMDHYSIASFLRRDNLVHAYGEDVELNGYSYFYSTLTDWIKNQINTQKDFGPLETIQHYIAECEHLNKMIISIGATRYTEFGEKTFLQKGDEIIIVLYDRRITSTKKLLDAVTHSSYNEKSMSVLAQQVI